jgi:hypothetical protein
MYAEGSACSPVPSARMGVARRNMNSAGKGSSYFVRVKGDLRQRGQKTLP